MIKLNTHQFNLPPRSVLISIKQTYNMLKPPLPPWFLRPWVSVIDRNGSVFWLILILGMLHSNTRIKLVIRSRTLTKNACALIKSQLLADNFDPFIQVWEVTLVTRCHNSTLDISSWKRSTKKMESQIVRMDQNSSSVSFWPRLQPKPLC